MTAPISMNVPVTYPRADRSSNRSTPCCDTRELVAAASISRRARPSRGSVVAGRTRLSLGRRFDVTLTCARPMFVWSRSTICMSA